MTAELPPGALRLVLVTPGDREPAATRGLVAACAGAGLGAVIVRERQLDERALVGLLDDVVADCRREGVAVLVSNRPDLAAACGAHGVHLGHGGPGPAEVAARQPELFVSLSAHRDQLDAGALDLDHAQALTLSPWAPTHRSRPRPLLTRDEVLRLVPEVAPRPVVLLGGITARHVDDLPPGPVGVAVIRALSEAADPAAATAELAAAVASWQARELAS